MPCNSKCYYRYHYEGTGWIKGRLYTKHRVQLKYFHQISQNSVGIKPRQIVLCWLFFYIYMYNRTYDTKMYHTLTRYLQVDWKLRSNRDNTSVNPIALRKAKIAYNFAFLSGQNCIQYCLSECSMVKSVGISCTHYNPSSAMKQALVWSYHTINIKLISYR